MPFTEVTSNFWISRQIDAPDVEHVRDEGVRLIVNNRPDGEEPGQPTSAEIAAAAHAAGVTYLHAPVRGAPSEAVVEQVSAALSEAGGPALAFCRSGMRSILTWALGEQQSGRRTREELVQLARAAGFELAPYLPG